MTPDQIIQEMLPDDEYEEMVEEMQGLYREGKRRNREKCTNLLALTAVNRRDWDYNEKPHSTVFPLLQYISNVSCFYYTCTPVFKYAYLFTLFMPPLTYTAYIILSPICLSKMISTNLNMTFLHVCRLHFFKFRKEFCGQVGFDTPNDVVSEWDGWMAKIVEVAKCEATRAPIAKLLTEYGVNIPITKMVRTIASIKSNLIFCIYKLSDYKHFIVLQMLMKLLFAKGTRGAILYKHYLVSY